MPLRSVRVRLTLWYLAILAVVLVAFGASIYFAMRRSLTESLTDAVESRADLSAASVTLARNGRPLLTLPDDATDPDSDDTFQRLLDTDGQPVADNSARLGGVALDRGAFERALQGHTSAHTQDTGARGEVRVVTRPVVRNGRAVGVLQAGELTADMQDMLRTLLLVIVVAVPAALALASFGGWWLGSRALRPIDRITRAAAEITANDLSRRLALELPDDEVGRLARTFDGMIARLDDAFARQRQFTADASHELRTPLTAVRGEIDVALSRARDPEEYRRTLAAISEQVDRMTRLVGALLLLARADAGVQPLRREPVGVRALVDAAAAQLRPQALARGLSLDVAPSSDAEIAGDEDLLLQLLLNLGVNAITYTPAGGVTLGWRAEDGVVELSVSDTGPGIPPEHRERIFERFHRVDPARARGGAGLGLAIARWIAEAHGGAIRVDANGAAPGATFTVALPKPD